MELMNIVLEGLEDFAIPYLDDIMIFSASPDEHLSHPRAVFNKIRDHRLNMKLKKCIFFSRQRQSTWGSPLTGKGSSRTQKRLRQTGKWQRPATSES